ncbi:hypothetical protein JTB14_031168 [Gonioctena quinquepunctata]|nr:hypothetical protein JTB14_031168 [Gonioctena quinquepunctata]
MVFTKMYVVPIILGFWFPITFIITYIVAVMTEHVRPILPYISDTGTWAPESCIFGMMLTLGGFMTVAIVYVRYRQVRDIIERFQFQPSTQKMNLWTLYMGILAAFGCIIVANFQETNVLSVHILGAALCFGMAAVHQIMQVILSFKLYPKIGSKSVNIFRIFCASTCTVCFFISFATGVVAILNFTGDDVTKWKKDDGGYEYHVISAASEYLMSLAVFVFFLTFTGEFKLIQFSEPILSQRS